MTRLGWFLLLAFLLVIGGFALIVNKNGRVAEAPPAARPAASATASAAGGGLILPVAGGKPPQLTHTRGDDRGAGTRPHHAIDIMAPRGTPVLAAAAGVVEKIFESANGGHTVYIRRLDREWQDYYAHLDSYAPDLREGIQVRQGQQIGTVGSTGDASPDGPHLHYEIHQMGPADNWSQGREINPYPVLKG